MRRQWLVLLIAALAIHCSAKKFGVKDVPDDYSFTDKTAEHTQAGISFDKAKKMDLAVKAFKAAAKYTLNSATAGNLGVVLMRQGEYKESHKWLTKAVELDASSKTAKENLAELEKHYKPPNNGSNNKKKSPAPNTNTNRNNAPNKQKAMPSADITMYDLDDYEPDAEEQEEQEQKSVQTEKKTNTQNTKNAQQQDDDYYEMKEGAEPQRASPPTVKLSTVSPSQVYLLAEPADRPRTRVGKQNPSFADAPNKEISIGGRREFYEFVASDAFRKSYYQRYPALIHTKGAFLDTLTLEQALGTHKYKYNGNKYEAPYKNVRFIKGTFSYKQGENPMQGPRRLAKALRDGYTLQFYGIQKWIPSVASLSLQLSKLGIKLPVNVNLYITPGAAAVSLIPHTDYQCSMMVQLTGKKRWKLWVKPEIAVPTHDNMIRGRDDDDELKPASLGEPYMDVTLQPGDVLYVPRGVIHATSTPESDVPSMHMTVGMEAMWDKGLSQTWFNMFGGGSVAHHNFMTEGWFEALRTRVAADTELRNTIDFDMYEKKPGSTWKENARKMMHKIVDTMVDDTSALDNARDALVATVERHNWELEHEFQATLEIALPDTVSADDVTRQARDWYTKWIKSKPKNKQHDEL